MTIVAHRIDTNGFMVEAVHVPDGTTNTVDIIVDLCPDGFYKPKWTGTQWVDGAPPSDQDKLDQAKAAKKAELYAAWTAACLTFQSNATGTLYTYTNDDKAIGRYNAIMNRILKDSTWNPPDIYTHEAGFVAHTAAQFTQVYDDGMASEQRQEGTYTSKLTDVAGIVLSAYPTVDDAIAAVLAIAW